MVEVMEVVERPRKRRRTRKTMDDEEFRPEGEPEAEKETAREQDQDVRMEEGGGDDEDDEESPRRASPGPPRPQSLRVQHTVHFEIDEDGK